MTMHFNIEQFTEDGVLRSSRRLDFYHYMFSKRQGSAKRRKSGKAEKRKSKLQTANYPFLASLIGHRKFATPMHCLFRFKLRKPVHNSSVEG